MIEHSTITLNTANTDGDGVWSRGDVDTRTEIGSSIIAGNVGDDDVFIGIDPTNSFVSLGHNLIGGGNDATDSFVQPGDQTGVFDPMLSPLQDNGGPTETHALLPGSPALDAGDLADVAGIGGVPLYDQRGEPFNRIVGDQIDIGAVERENPTLPGDGNLDGQVSGLDYLIWAANFGDNPADDPPGSPQNGDYNNDGIVSGLDYLVWASHFGEGAAVVASVPATATFDNVTATPSSEELAAVDLAMEDDYDTGATIADEPAVRQWQLSRAFDSVLKKARGLRKGRA